MAETTEERLERLRREVAAEGPLPAAMPATPSSPALPETPREQPRAAPIGPEAYPPVALPGSRPSRVPLPETTGTLARGAGPAYDPPGALGRGEDPASEPTDVLGSLRELGAASWVGIGLVVLGGYLLLARVVPGVSVVGTLVLVVAGLLLLGAHFGHRLGPWALHAGALLAAVGVARLFTDVIPLFPSNGSTAIAVGLAFLGIGYLRHSQAGGWGWQGIGGGLALALGLLQLAGGLLPGSPGALDLLFPIAVAGLGVLLVGRAMRGRGDAPHP